MKEITRNNDEWVKCSKCGHKLFKSIRRSPVMLELDSGSFVDGLPTKRGNTIEIKCHSCKEINVIEL